MTKVAVVAGWGVGVGDAVVKAFAKEGFSFALLSRNQAKLDKAVDDYAKEGITAKGYAVDLGEHKEVASVIARVHDDLGAVEVLVWNAVAGLANIAKGSPEVFVNELKIGIGGLQAATQAALEDLKATKGSIFVSGGGYGLDIDPIHDLVAAHGVASLAINKAAQRKWAAVAHRELKELGVYVAEISIQNIVKGTQFDPKGTSNLSPETVGKAFVDAWKSKDKAVVAVASD
jgi:short-subunit dehydrogenase